MTEEVVFFGGRPDPQDHPSLTPFSNGVAIANRVTAPTPIFQPDRGPHRDRFVRSCRRSPQRYCLLIFAPVRDSEIVIAG